MAVKLNEKAVGFISGQINAGNVDTESDWSGNEPTPQSEDSFLSAHSFPDYSNWFLGIDPDTNPNTKEHYSFPVGDFKQVFRSGLIAAEQRAGQYHHEDIKAAAHKLIEMIGE